MKHILRRRQFLQISAGVGAALLGATTAARADAGAGAGAAKGRVLFGFTPTPNGVHGMQTFLRGLQGRYQPDLGQRLVYMPGNSGALAMKAVIDGPADGGTVLFSPSAAITLFPQLHAQRGMNPLTDLVAVAPFCEFALALAVGPAVPVEVKTVSDYMRWAGNNPLLANYAVLGLGTSGHFMGNALAQSAGNLLKPVAYKSMVSLLDDLASGGVPAAIIISTELGNVANGSRVRLLAVTSDERWPGLPNVPTFREQGFTEVVMVESAGFFVSARTPAEKVRELAQAIYAAVTLPEVNAEQLAGGFRSPPAGSETYAALVAKEHSGWVRLIKKQQFTLAS